MVLRESRVSSVYPTVQTRALRSSEMRVLGSCGKSLDVAVHVRDALRSPPERLASQPMSFESIEIVQIDAQLLQPRDVTSVFSCNVIIPVLIPIEAGPPEIDQTLADRRT